MAALTDAEEAAIRRLLADAPPLPDTVRALLVRDFAQTPADTSSAKAA